MAFYTILPEILNMSLTAGVAVVFVLLLRLLLKKAPKVISYALWAVVLFRLLCPVSIESVLSLFSIFGTPTVAMTGHSGAGEYISSAVVHTELPEVVLSVPGIGEAITEVLPQGEEQLRTDLLETPIFIAAVVWWGGILVMAVYGFVSYLRLRRRLVTASPLRDNIWLADDIASPFVMGLLRPKIYLPSAMEEREQSYIILHEQHHIRRMDHIVKALAFAALCMHWFNPLVWAAFILSGKDMEMSCDEAVVHKLGTKIRADYTASLLSMATGRRIIAGMPLAFGEGNTKGRIKNLANRKKPALWFVLLAAAACLVLAAGLLTDPVGFRFDEASDTIVSANHFDMRNADDAAVVEMNTAQISELSSRLARVRNTKKSEEYGGFTPGYQISALLKNGTYIRISGYSLSETDMVDIAWNGDRYVVSDSDFQDYLSRICAGGDTAPAEEVPSGIYVTYEAAAHMEAPAMTDDELAAWSLEEAVSDMILNHHAGPKSSGLIPVESHVVLAEQSVPVIRGNAEEHQNTLFLLVYYMEYSTYGGRLAEKSGAYIPTAITFKITDSGEYVLEEYWEPRDGSYYVKDIRDKFPGAAADDALNGQAYIADLKEQTCNKALAYWYNNNSLAVRIEDLLNEIQTSPALSSNPGDYIHEHETEYDELLSYGEYTLKFCFTEFLRGGQIDLRGHIMALACQDIMLALGEGYALDQDPVTGQEWFHNFSSNAERLSRQYSSEDLEKFYPGSYLLLELK